MLLWSWLRAHTPPQLPAPDCPPEAHRQKRATMVFFVGAVGASTSLHPVEAGSLAEAGWGEGGHREHALDEGEQEAV